MKKKATSIALTLCLTTSLVPIFPAFAEEPPQGVEAPDSSPAAPEDNDGAFPDVPTDEQVQNIVPEEDADASAPDALPEESLEDRIEQSEDALTDALPAAPSAEEESQADEAADHFKAGDVVFKDIVGIDVYAAQGGSVERQDSLDVAAMKDGDLLVRVRMADLPAFFGTVSAHSEKDGALHLTVECPGGDNETIVVEYGRIESGVATAKPDSSAGSAFLQSLTSVAGYDAARSQAYGNIYKMAPFLSADALVAAGNKLDPSDALATKQLDAVLPFDANGSMVNYLTASSPQSVAKVKLSFADKTAEDRAVSYSSSQAGVATYALADGAPYQFSGYAIDPASSGVQALKSHIESTDYDGYLAKLSGSMRDNRSVRDYYQVLKTNAEDTALNVLANSAALPATADSALYVDLLEATFAKEVGAGDAMLKTLYAYNYVERFYNFEIGGVNVSDLLLFHGELYDASLGAEAIGARLSADNAALRGGAKTHEFYRAIIGQPFTHLEDIDDFISDMVLRFTDYGSANDWFTDLQTKRAAFREVASDRFDYRAFHQLSKRPQYLLPIFTLPEGSYYLATTPGLIMVGNVSGYATPTAIKEGRAVAIVQEKIDAVAPKFSSYLETIGGMIDAPDKVNGMVVLSMDRRSVMREDGRGYDLQYMEGERDGQTPTEEPFLKNYTELVGIWKAHGQGNSAVGGNETIRWDAYQCLTDLGTWSHEMGHNIDERWVLKGKKRRGVAEDYTDGIVSQYITSTSVSFNLMHDYAIDADVATNLTPERIDTPEEVHDFYAGMYDTIDLLDYLEAQAFLDLTTEEKNLLGTTIFYRKNAQKEDVGYDTVGFYSTGYIQEKMKTAPFWYPSSYDIYKFDPQSMSDLYDSRVALVPGAQENDEWTITWYVADGMNKRWWHQPHFGPDPGRADSRNFKTWAFRMLGEKGYDQGFVEWLSGSGKGDLKALQGVTGYDSFKDYKMARYAEVEQNLDSLSYLDAEALQQEYYEALKADAANGDRNLTQSTNVRMRAYYLIKRMSNDFQGEIYGGKAPVTYLYTADDLRRVSEVPNGNYALAADIDASALDGGFVVPGSFVGKLDGRGFTIDTGGKQLFERVKHAYVSNMAVVGNPSSQIASQVENSSITGMNVIEGELRGESISSVDEFKTKIAANPDGAFTLTADLDFSLNKEKDFVHAATFTGELDGNGHTVSGLDGYSLFKHLFGANVRDVVFKDCRNVKSGKGSYANVLTQSSNASRMTDLTFDSVELGGYQFVGAVTGKDDPASIIERIAIRNATMAVNDGGSECGLVIGRGLRTVVQDVTVQGAVTSGGTSVGGVAGVMNNGQVNHAVVDVDFTAAEGISADGKNAGIVGSAEESPAIKNSIFMGSLTGAAYGIVGPSDKVRLEGLYELDSAVAAGGITSVNGDTVQSITQQAAQDPSLYEGMGFSGDIWNFDDMDGSGPQLLGDGMNLSSYRASADQAEWTHPTKTGMAFAGWYADSECTVPIDPSVTKGVAYPKFVKVDEVGLFLGGSLRMGDSADNTSLRFGNDIVLPEGATLVGWGWDYGTDPYAFSQHVEGENGSGESGALHTNLVVTDAAAEHYGTTLHAQMTVTYKTADGTTVAMKAKPQQRAIIDVAKAILEEGSAATPEERVYAQKVKDAYDARMSDPSGDSEGSVR
ncbi:MAG: ZmpA/ZmpB/ZmpC family metallo-endopeptidase [Slackia sp.]|nr:ZmpA/ZmpB/ZmpC family metallo-endopeptidase [Slackia sp.]